MIDGEIVGSAVADFEGSQLCYNVHAITDGHSPRNTEAEGNGRTSRAERIRAEGLFYSWWLLSA